MDGQPFNELDPTKAPAPTDELDDILARADGGPVLAPVLVSEASFDKQLEGTEDVDALLPVIRRMLEAEAAAKGKRVYPTRLLRHQHIIAFLLANPFTTALETCRFFGIGPTTLYNIARSDTFKALAAKHHVKLNDSPDIQQQLKDTLVMSIEVVQKALVSGQDPDYAATVMDKSANRLGLGVKQGTQVNIQNNQLVTPDMIAAARERKRLTGGANGA